MRKIEVLGVLWIAAVGCVSIAPPEDRVAAAELQIRKAEDGLAAQYAPLDLLKAREKYEGARRAMLEKDYDAARRLAERSPGSLPSAIEPRQRFGG